MPCSPDGLREVAGMGLAVASSYQAVYNYSTNLMSGSPKAVEICAKVRSVNLSMCALMLTESCFSVLMKKNQIIIDINKKKYIFATL